MLFIAVQLILFYLMLLIGLNCTHNDLLRVKKQPIFILGISLAQSFTLPLLAYFLVLLFEPVEHIAVGMMLISICPSGALSNFYSLLAKADTALSVTLTTVSSLLSVFLLPIILLIFYPHFIKSNDALLDVATTQIILLAATLLAPVLIGIALRWRLENKIIRILPILERVGFISLLVLIMAILFKNSDRIGEHLLSLISLASVFTLLAMGAATIFAWFTSQNMNAAITIICEFPVRNLAIASIVALNVFQREDYLLFAALFVVIQTPFILLLISYRRRKTNVD
jgi:BASS family bile acid:Na+ symporter